MHGEDSEAGRGAGDLTRREVATLLPIVVMILWIGLFPSTLLGKIEASVQGLVWIAEQASQASSGGLTSAPFR